MKRKVVRFEIQDLLPIGLTLVVAGIGLTYGLSVMSDVKSDIKVSSTSAIVNETVVHGAAVTQASLFVGVSACRNITNEVVLPIGTTCNVSSEGSVSLSTLNASSARIDYTHYTPSTEYNASIEAVKGISKIPEKMPLIATVIVAAIIIGILVRYLMVRFA